MSEPKVIYLGPACEAETSEGRTWAEDNPWADCECGHRPVQYVLGETFDRMKAERDALQLLLNNRDEQLHTLEQSRRAHFENAQAAERRIDDLTRVDADDGVALIAQHRAFIELGSEALIDAASDFQDQAYALGLARGLQKGGEAADHGVKEPTQRHSEYPEGKRERFQKWVMATRHPVLGFLDGRSLARGDDRSGYADVYVQGLWVAYQAFGGFASRDDSIGWLKRIDGIGQNRAELIYSMGFRRRAD